MDRLADDDDLVRAAGRERVVPLARGMALTTPLIGLGLLAIGRPDAPTAVAWLLLVAASSAVALVVTRVPAGGVGMGPSALSWERRYSAYVVACSLVWSVAPWVLRPVGEPELQTAQVLVLTTVGNSLVLLGAFLPRLSRAALVAISCGTMVSLLVAGTGANRWLAGFVPLYTVLSCWMQGHLHAAASRTIRLAIENQRLLARLAEDQQVLQHEATHDRLTGLLNRAAFLDRAYERARLARAGGGRMAVAYVDLDGFKGLNDRHGHAVGDAVLVAVAERLRGSVRADDVLARFGGDEFTVLFGAPGDAVAAAHRALDAFRSPVEVDGVALPVGLSVGIATSDGGVADVDELLRHADRALYDAKARGRGRVEVHQPGPAA